MEQQELRLAVLIDADNAPRTAIRDVMAEVAVYGIPTVKRIYGDWTSPNMSTWKPLLLENAITPIQQYAYTTGKNATDSAMIIDAMDILYSGRVDGFVLVSSDSDFTRLATRLREAGMKVFGMGERKTPNPFIVACDKFVYIEVIRAAAKAEAKRAEAEAKAAKEAKKTAQTAKAAAKRTASKKKQPEPEPRRQPENDQTVPEAIVELLADSVEDIADESGFAFLGDLGNLLLKKQPDFDSRNFGFSKLTKLVRSLDRFEVDVRDTTLPNVKQIYVRDKDRR